VAYRKPRRIPVDSILLGGENGVSGARYAEKVGDPLRTSRLFREGPHVALFREFAHSAPDQIPDETLLATDYGSDLYQVVDGNHRLARTVSSGATDVEVRIHRVRTRTAAQERLREMAWLRGSSELYQPVPLPEVVDWPLVRRCDDRLAMMTSFLGDATGMSYLDVASFFGWFVARMRERGYRAFGVELDPLAVEFGNLVYALPDHAVAVGDVVDYLEGPRAFDVISCFSLMHHFALGRGSVSAEELLDLIDRACERVLFFDTGQATERWFADLLPDWTPEFIGKWLLANSTFTRVHALGTDQDGVGRYAGNYGRTLFACTRD
jgi:SAM-dependent methyltransferase